MNHVSDEEKMYEGTPHQIELQILFDYPFVRSSNMEDRNDLMGLLELLGSNQAYEVGVEHDELEKSDHSLSELASSDLARAQLGYDPTDSSEFSAAAFLAGRDPVKSARQAFLEADGNLEHAALLSYGFEVTEKNLESLRAVQKIDSIKKSEIETPQTLHTAVAMLPEGEEAAIEVRRAIKDQFVFNFQLAGKHSSGSMVVKDPETGRVWLLKPGSSGTGPSAGADEDPSGPSQREAAFYQVAKEVGLWEFYPRCELLQLDDKMFAAMTLLPWSFKTAEKRRKTEPNVIRAILHPYLNNGDVHKWAALDAILGNNDSHGENVMVDDEGNVRMIDHGSAFAGPSFDPAHDKNAFVPYCLRAWGPEAFNTLPPEQKAKYLPRVGRQVADKLHSWLTSINPNVLAATLTRYGINQAPSLDRLAKLKNMATEMPVDEAVNRFWVTV